MITKHFLYIFTVWIDFMKPSLDIQKWFRICDVENNDDSLCPSVVTNK